jgi:hypothetical protein
VKRNNRKYSRINTYMPFDVRLLSPEEHSMKSRISDDDIVIDSMRLPEIEDKDLYAWLSAINSKLDMLLMSRKDNFCEMVFKPLNISASGMRFSSKQKFNNGDLLEIKIVLHVDPHKILYLVAVVMRVEQLSFKLNSYNIAVKFLEMTDEIKNELLKYDFSRQAELISGKKASN